MNKTLIIVIVLILGVSVAYALMGDSTKKDMMETDTTQMKKEMNDDDMMMDDEEEGVLVGGALMVQSKDIVENAMNADNVTTVVAAVAAAGLVDTLKSAGPFTVFAPNNAAFAALPAGTVDTLLLPENKDQLVNILTYHVVTGSYTSADLKDGMTLETVQGETIEISKVGSKITVNGNAMVETADVISSNGVTFVIDAVLMPPTQ